MDNPKKEKTFLLIKPDGVKKGLIGKIISRLEQRDLKIVRLEMVQATKEDIDEHYPKDESWIERLGEKTLGTYEKYGIDPEEELGESDPLEIGKKVREWLKDFMTSAPVVKMIVEGVHARDMVRKVVGSTIPSDAAPGTIRGDFSMDSAVLANKEKRAIMNLVHASETEDEVENELDLWFSDAEPFDYDRYEE